MAWNPSPEVAVARDVAKRLGDADQIVILALDREAGTMKTITYGRTKQLCDEAEKLGEGAEDGLSQKLVELIATRGWS